MKLEQFVQSLLLAGYFVIVVTTPAKSEGVKVLNVEGSGTPTGTSVSSTQPLKPTKEILQLSQIKHPFKNAQLLVQAPTTQPTVSQQVVEVTGVKVNSTTKGFEIVLETPKGEQLQVLPKSDGNTYIVDIPSAQLRLPSGNTFRQEKPVEGITEVTVTNLDTNSIRVSVTGTAGVPTIEVFDSKEGLIVGFTPVASTAQQPQTQPQTQPQQEPTPSTGEPESETKPSTPSAGQNEPIELLVTGSTDDYNVPDASAVTRFDTPIRDTPRSIRVIPRAVIEDQKVIRLDEALRNVSGVATDNNFGGSVDSANIRGFTARFLQNGFSEVPGSSSFGILRESANIERVEVLKGPASVLYGNVEPGGIINLVTKKPLEVPLYSGEFTVGSYSFYRPSIDFSGPLTTDKSFLYRLNAVYENSSSFRDFTDIERYFIAPAFTWKIGQQTDLTVELNYLNDERPFDRGLVAFGRGVADIPISRRLGEPGDVRQTENTSVGYNLEHRFSDNWTLRNSFRGLFTDEYTRRFEPRTLNERTGVLSREFRIVEANRESYALQTDLIGKFKTGSIQHQTLFGIDLSRTTTDQVVFRERRNVASINIFNPVYGAAIPNAPLSNDDETRIDALGIYLQDQINFSKNFILLLGGRFDVVELENTYNLEDTSPTRSDTAFSPNIGIVYKPIEPVSLYASFSQSFQPNPGTTSDFSILEPERSTQYEVGAKAEFLDGRLSATLAAFEITKNNVATTDPDDSESVIAIGEQKSRGIELDIVGQITPGWNIIATYAYTDAKITEDVPQLEGNRLINVPEHSASLWTTYEIQQGALQGLGFGAGLFFVGERAGDNENTFVLPSYVRSDAAVYYRRNNWRVALNVKNLFDIRYFESSGFGRERVYPGAPLTVLGTVSIEF